MPLKFWWYLEAKSVAAVRQAHSLYDDLITKGKKGESKKQEGKKVASLSYFPKITKAVSFVQLLASWTMVVRIVTLYNSSRVV